MKIATEIGSIATHFGEEKAIEMVAKAGFDGWDFTMTKMAEVDHKTGEFISSGFGGHGFRTRRGSIWTNNIF